MRNKKLFFCISMLFLFFLLCFSFVKIVFLEVTEKVELKKVWTSEVEEQVNPLVVFDNDGIKLGDNIFYVEKTTYSDFTYNSMSIRSIDGKSSKNIYTSMYNLDSKYFYYFYKECYFSDECSAFIHRLNENLDDEKTIEFDGNLFENIETFNYDNNNIDTIYEAEDGSRYFYSSLANEDGTRSVLKVDKDFKTLEKVTLNDEELNNYFPKLNKIASKISTLNNDPENSYQLNSYVEIGENTIYVGGMNRSKAYLEVVDKDGEVIHSSVDSKYVNYSNPVILEDYVIVKADYDEKQTLGSKKADLIVLDQNGNNVYTLKNDSYYTDLIIKDKALYAERIYIEGLCTSEVKKVASYVTYNAWNVDSCKTYRYYETYNLEKTTEVKDTSVNIKNPETSVFSIIIFIVASMLMIVLIKKNLSETKYLK